MVPRAHVRRVGCGQAPTPGVRYGLKLYIVGQRRSSLIALANLDKLSKLGCACDIEVIDLQKRPELAKRDGIVATPTLVRFRPKPVLRVVGDLSNTDRTRTGLELRVSEVLSE